MIIFSARDIKNITAPFVALYGTAGKHDILFNEPMSPAVAVYGRVKISCDIGCLEIFVILKGTLFQM